MGSMKGGTILTITGKYFGKHTQIENVEIKIGEIDCRVISVAEHTIKCMTSEANEDYIKQGIFPGKCDTLYFFSLR